MKDKEQSKAEEFLKKKLYKDNYESVGVYSMSSICVLFGTMVEAMQEYAEQYHAEKQRTDDRELLIRFAKHTFDALNISNNKRGLTIFVDEFLSGQIPAKEKCKRL
jgi:Tfp pilus assembly protein PilF